MRCALKCNASLLDFDQRDPTEKSKLRNPMNTLRRHLLTYGQLFIWFIGATGQGMKLCFYSLQLPHTIVGALMRSKGELVEVKK